jgi:hypothetical protein
MPSAPLKNSATPRNQLGVLEPGAVDIDALEAVISLALKITVDP